MSQDSDDEKKRPRNKRRSQRPYEKALAQIRQSAQSQLSVLTSCSDQLKKADCEASLRACRLKTSNEVKKLKVIVAQLDSLTTRLPNDEKEAVLPEIETLRQSIGKGIEQFNDSFDEANLSLDLDKGDCDSSHNTQETIHDPDNDVNEQHMERTAEIASQKQVLQSWQQLEDVIRDLNDVFSQLSHSVWTQKQTTDRIETNVIEAHERFYRGAVTLSQIKKASTLPLVGAAIGTAIAGPIGMVLGYKAAAVACLGTAVAGYWGGKKVQQLSSLPMITRQEPSGGGIAIEEEERARDQDR